MAQLVRLPLFMMVRLLLLLALLVALVHTSTVRDSNRFLDIILEDKLPQQIKVLKHVYPFVKVPDFKFKIKSTGITNRELKVKVKYGVLNGFDTGVHRIGECHPPVLIKGNITVSCLLEFNGINASLIAQVKGDTLARKEKIVSVNVTVVDTVANFEATAYPGHPGKLNTFHIEQIRFHTVCDRRLSLNSERQRSFNNEIERALQNVMYDLFYTDYKKALEKAVESMPFPRA
uniref:Amblyomma 40 33 family member n=1 Tax=Rhipicephalus zambeziensis TaxID=60191 RepID=A0A224YR73_9ACAR